MEQPAIDGRDPGDPGEPATPVEPADPVDPPDTGDPLDPEDPGDAALEAALADPAFDELPAAEDPGRPEDPFHEPGAPHLSLDEDEGEGRAGGGEA